MFLVAVRWAEARSTGLWAGAVYGLTFFGGLMWWLSLLDPLALILVPVQAIFPALYGWWLSGRRTDSSPRWLVTAVSGWAVMELVRYRVPVGGQEWGAAGYALSDNFYLRLLAAGVGTTGLTVVVVMLAAMLALVLIRRWEPSLLWGALVPILALVATLPSVLGVDDTVSLPVAIVQGSTPCPFEHCPPNERLRTYQQHLALTETIDPGSVDLVVWPESSTGSSNADPVNTPAVAEAISAQARRIGAAMLIGGDRSVGDDEFLNVNVFFDSDGRLVGEYRKQHAVPFGEYIPWRPLFEWIPALERVPRDMIPGDGAVIFDLDGRKLGSVISWEGGFSRYALEHRRAGADVLAVATNKASYGPDAPTSDQFIGMTRMRAVELGVPVIHAAVTGKSTIIDHQGSFDDITETGESVVLYGVAASATSTVYSVVGDLVMYLAALAGVGLWLLDRRVVGSGDRHEERGVAT